MPSFPRARSLALALVIALLGPALSTVSLEAEAARLGRGRPAGMQRQMPPAKPADASPTTPAQPAAPTNQAAPAATPGVGAGAAAGAGRRSWMGPLAGLAAGLGLAALASHFGFGAAFANMMTLALVALVGVFVLRWAMRRFASPPPAAAGAGTLQYPGASAPARFEPRPTASPVQAQSQAPAQAGLSSAPPSGFDAEAFERTAKMMFIRMQAANDAGDVDDLRRFTTPELFGSLRLDLQERGAAAQQTDVVQLQARVVDTAQEPDRQVVTVRFHGLIREAAQDGAQPFDELWHLVKPADGSREWAVAGITPTQ